MPNYITPRDAAELLLTTNHILVIGCSGGGKSTLSRKLSNLLKLEYISIDRDVRWLPGWVERNKQEQRKILSQLVKRDRWVMDGSGASTFDIRLPRAELVLWVRVPRHMALLGLARRVFRYFGTTRPDMAAGCPEPIPDREFLSYIWNFEKIHAPKFITNLNLYGPNVPVAILKSYHEIDIMLTQVALKPNPSA